DEKFLKNVVKKFLVKEKINTNADLSIALVDAEEIKKLNKQYRGINKATDVLSFGKFEKKSKLKDFSDLEIVICPKEVQKNAKNTKEPFEKELARVLIHALLHLNGFEHEQGGAVAQKMFTKQEKYLALFRFNFENK
ncbi:MAG: rRNA maturation RNase YbeY, partial [Candidatus Paceibacterota bacterium]